MSSISNYSKIAIDLVKNGDIEKLRIFFHNREAEGFSMDLLLENIRDAYFHRQTLLHVAAQYGQTEILRSLLLSKEFVAKTTFNSAAAMVSEKRCRRRSTALHTAVNENQMSTVRFLVEEVGCDIYEQLMPEWPTTCLHFAAQSGRIEMLRYFLEPPHSMDPNSYDAYAIHSPLHYAVASVWEYENRKTDADIEERIDMIKMLITQYRCDPYRLERRTENSLLHTVAEYGHVKIARFLTEGLLLPTPTPTCTPPLLSAVTQEQQQQQQQQQQEEKGEETQKRQQPQPLLHSTVHTEGEIRAPAPSSSAAVAASSTTMPMLSLSLDPQLKANELGDYTTPMNVALRHNNVEIAIYFIRELRVNPFLGSGPTHIMNNESLEVLEVALGICPPPGPTAAARTSDKHHAISSSLLVPSSTSPISESAEQSVTTPHSRTEINSNFTCIENKNRCRRFSIPVPDPLYLVDRVTVCGQPKSVISPETLIWMFIFATRRSRKEISSDKNKKITASKGSNEENDSNNKECDADNIVNDKWSKIALFIFQHLMSDRRYRRCRSRETAHIIKKMDFQFLVNAFHLRSANKVVKFMNLYNTTNVVEALTVETVAGNNNINNTGNQKSQPTQARGRFDWDAESDDDNDKIEKIDKNNKIKTSLRPINFNPKTFHNTICPFPSSNNSKNVAPAKESTPLILSELCSDQFTDPSVISLICYGYGCDVNGREEQREKDKAEERAEANLPLWSPIFAAVFDSANVDVIKELIRRGADVSSYGNPIRIPLIQKCNGTDAAVAAAAATSGPRTTADMDSIVSMFALLNRASIASFKITPLHAAALRRCEYRYSDASDLGQRQPNAISETIATLLDAGADATAPIFIEFERENKTFNDYSSSSLQEEEEKECNSTRIGLKAEYESMRPIEKAAITSLSKLIREKLFLKQEEEELEKAKEKEQRGEGDISKNSFSCESQNFIITPLDVSFTQKARTTLQNNGGRHQLLC